MRWKKGFPILSIVCLGAAFLYLVYASIGLFQDHYIGEHFEKAMQLQWRLQMFSLILPGAELVLPASDNAQTQVDGNPYDAGEKRYLTVLDYIALLGAWVIIPVCIFN
jgi:hypothetical protein